MVTIDSIIDGKRITGLQYIVFGVCFVMNMLDGMDVLVISYTASSIMAEWDISGAETFGVVFSAGLIGMTAGALLIAPKTDIIGRKPMILMSAVLMGLSILATAYAGNIYELVGFRFLSGLGIGSMLASTPTLTSEYSPRKYKDFWISLVLSGYPCGAVLSGLLAAQIIPDFGWRSMYLTAGLLTLATVPFIYFFLPESLEFLISKRPRNGLDKFNMILNKLKVDTVSSFPELKKNPLKTSVVSLFVQSLRIPTISLWVAFFMSFGSLYFLVSWIPKLAEGTGMSLELAIYAGAIFNLGSFFGIIVQGYLSSRLGLYRVIGSFLIFAAILMAVFGYFTGSVTILIVFGLIGFAIQGGFVGLYSVGAQLYMTEIRTTGIGWAIGAGRLGAIFGPFLGGLMIGSGMTLETNFLIFAIPLIIAALATFNISVKKVEIKTTLTTEENL